MRRDSREFLNRDTEVIVVGPEKPGKFRDFWNKEQMPFTGVPDPDHKIADMFGQEVKLLKLGRMPATVIVDKSGNMVYSHYGKSMVDTLDTKTILSVLDELQP